MSNIENDIEFHQVPKYVFLESLSLAQLYSQKVRAATTNARVLGRHLRDEVGAVAYLSRDMLSGYLVRENGELVGVFSVVKGRGDALVASAVRNGATHLDCFHGYLTELYGRHGFTEVRREPNWVADGPDVVWMRLTVPAAP